MIYLIFLAGMIGSFLLFFNRDPLRTPPKGDLILAPADGKVIAITAEGDWDIIVTFMDLLNIHVQWVPYSGKVLEVERIEGSKVIASKPEAAHNQQVVTTIETKLGNVVIKQITGIIARRIKTFIRSGETVKVGQRLGKITLGSRVELWLPRGKTEIKVRKNEKVLAGLTVLAIPK
jgi:phosphatidylserine decarboxylase